MNLFPIVMFTGGVVLMYAAVVDADPRDVVKNALAGKKTPKKEPDKTSPITPVVPGKPIGGDGTQIVTV